MSTTVDERVVQMRFDNDQFESGVKTSLNSISKLKKETDFSGIEKAANNVNLNGLYNAFDNVSSKSIAKITVIKTAVERLTNDVINTANKVVNKIKTPVNKIFSIIKEKGWTRAANLENAEFQLDGLGIAWEKISKQISNAVDGTAYGLDSAAKAASQLAASGVKIGENFKFSEVIQDDVDEMERALGAISGIAAMTNSTYDDIADIFTSAAGKGRVQADEFNRIAARGLNAAATLAEALGVTEAEVKDMASQGEISFQTFADAMYDAYYKQAKKSNETFDGALANMKAALGRIGALFATPLRKALIDPFNSLRQMINRVKSDLEPLAETFEHAANAASRLFVNFIDGIDEDKLSFISDLVEGIKNILHQIVKIGYAVINAFKDVFDIDIFESIKNLSEGFKNLTANLIPTNEVTVKIYKAFYMTFTVIKSVFSIIKQLASAIGKINIGGTSLADVLGKIISKVLTVIAYTIIVIDKSGIIEKIINGLSDSIKFIVTVIGKLISAGKTLVTELFQKIIDWANKINNTGNPVSAFVDSALSGINKLINAVPGFISAVGNIFDSLTNHKSLKESFDKDLDDINQIKTETETVMDEMRYGANPVNYVTGTLTKGENSNQNTVLNSLSSIFKGYVNIITAGVNTFKQVVKTVSTIVGTLINTFIEKFKEGKIEITSGKVAVLAYVAGVLSLIASFKKMVKGVTGVTDSISTAFKGISTSAKDLTSALSTFFGNDKKKSPLARLLDTLSNAASKKTTFADFAKSLLKVVAALGAVVAMVIILGKLPTEELNQGATYLVSIAGALGIFVEVLILLNAEANMFFNGDGLNFINKLSAAILVFAISIGVLVGAMNNIDTGEGILKRLGSLIAIMLSLATASVIVGKFGGSMLKTSLLMISFALAIKLLCNVLNDMPNITGALVGLTALVIGFMGIATLFAEGIEAVSWLFEGTAKLLLSISASALLMAVAIKIINTIPWPDLGAGLGKMATILALVGVCAVVMAKTLNKQGKDLPKIAGLLIAMSLCVAILGEVVKSLSEVKDTGALFSGGIIVAGLMALVSALAYASKFTEKAHPLKFAASLLLITGCIALLSGLAVLIGLVPEDQLERGTTVIGTLLVLVGLLEGLSALTEKANVKAIIALMVSLEVLFTTMIVMSMITEWTTMWYALGSMLAIMGTFAILLRTIGKMGEVNVKTIVTLGVAAAAIVGIAFSIREIAKIGDWASIGAAGVAMLFTLLSFSKILSTISKQGSTFSKERIKSFCASCSILATAALGIALIAAVGKDWTTIAAAGGALAATMLAFSLILATISKQGRTFSKPRIASFCASCSILATAALGLTAIAAVGKDWTTIAAAGAALSATILAFSVALLVISKANFSVSKCGAFALASVALIPMAAALYTLSGYSWNEIWPAMVSLSGCMLALAGAMAVMSKNGSSGDLFAGGGIIMAAAGMVILAKALVMFNDVSWDALAGAGAALLGITVAIAALSGLGETAAIGAAVLLAASVALGVMAVSMRVAADAMTIFQPVLDYLQTYDFTTVGNGLLTLSSGLSAFGLACVVIALGIVGLAAGAVFIKPFAEGLLLLSQVTNLDGMGANIAAIGAGCIVLGVASPAITISAVALILLAEAFNLLAPALEKVGTAFNNCVTAISNGIETLKTLLDKSKAEELGNGFVTSLGNGLEKEETWVSMETNLSGNTDTYVIQTLEKAKDSAEPAGETVLSAFGDGLSNSSIWTSIGNAVKNNIKTNVLNAITGGWSSTVSGAKKAASNIYNGVKSVINSNSSSSKSGSGNFLTNLYNNTFGSNGVLNNTINDVKEKVNDFKEQLSDFDEEGLDFNDLLDKMGVSTEDLADVTNSVTEATNSMTDSLSSATDALTSEGSAASSSTDSLSSLSDTISNQLDLFSEFDTSEEISSEKLLNNMRSQIYGISNWASNLQELSKKGIDQGLLKYLAELGPQGYKYVNAFVQMSSAQLSEANALYANSLVLPDSAASQITASYQNAGNLVGTSFSDGIDTHAADTAAAETASNAVTAMESSDGLAVSNGTSTKVEEVGETVSSTLANSLSSTSSTSTLTTAVETVCNNILNKFSTKLSQSAFDKIGYYLDKGLANGIYRGAILVYKAVDTVTNNSITRAKRNYDTNSPSRVFMGIGEYLSLGLAKGITNESGTVYSAIDNLSNTSINGMQQTISELSNIIPALEDSDLQPTITPVLDLSNVRTGMGFLSNMSGSSPLQLAYAGNVAMETNSAFQNGGQNGNSDVVSAINELRTDFNSLSTAVSNMQVVMDSGVLVGQISGDMDTALGTLSRRNGRTR